MFIIIPNRIGNNTFFKKRKLRDLQTIPQRIQNGALEIYLAKENLFWLTGAPQCFRQSPSRSPWKILENKGVFSY